MIMITRQSLPHQVNRIIVDAMEQGAKTEPSITLAGQRGPGDHQRRQQIIAAADEHFRLYGYGKTTVADLARSLGLSPAYIYIYFKSKQAVGEAVCNQELDKIVEEVKRVCKVHKSPSEQLRRVFSTLVELGKARFLSERKLHDIILVSLLEKWSSSDIYLANLLAVVRNIVAKGRETGDFERKTPLDETCQAIMQTLVPFINPLLIERDLDTIDENSRAVAALVLRSLSR
jgi:AcrR family transcriptional regulator